MISVPDDLHTTGLTSPPQHQQNNQTDNSHLCCRTGHTPKKVLGLHRGFWAGRTTILSPHQSLMQSSQVIWGKLSENVCSRDSKMSTGSTAHGHPALCQWLPFLPSRTGAKAELSLILFPQTFTSEVAVFDGGCSFLE